MFRVRTLCAAGAALLMLGAAAQAHFIWIVLEPAESAKQAKVYFGEYAGPDDPELLGRIEKAEAWSAGDGRSETAPLTLVREENADAITIEIPEKFAARPVILRHNYGVMSRGDSKTLLRYFAKAYPSVTPGAWKAIEDNDRLTLEVNAEPAGEELKISVTWQGKPLAASQITIEGPGLQESLKGETNESGVLKVKLPESGLYSIWARHIDETPGELDGKAYDKVGNYSTLAVPYTIPTATSSKHHWPDLEKGVTSFGGAVLGDSLYVYGGHFGQAHHYSTAGQSGEFIRLNLKNPAGWESLAGGPKLTGLALVSHNNKLYRIGGFTATNEESEDEVLISQPDFARFDPTTGAWETLVALPAGRSSHDAAVVGDTLYVVGGWEMKAGEDAKWHDTALSMDLSADALEWKTIPNPPFHRRALSAAAHNGSLYVLGGMQEKGGPSTRIDIYDPAAQTWSQGPSLLGGGMDGFGASAFANGGRLYVTTMSGAVQQLADDGSEWKLVGQLEHPRFFHRLLPWQSDFVAVGGASMATGKIVELELLSVSGNDSLQKKSASLK